jgi:hypothetical protein
MSWLYGPVRKQTELRERAGTSTVLDGLAAMIELGLDVGTGGGGPASGSARAARLV